MPYSVCGVVSIFILVFTQMSIAETDTLVASNGNVLVGEIKSMNRGVLFMETDYSDNDFEIEWKEVREIYSDRKFVVFLSENTKYYGKIRTDVSNKNKIIITDDKGNQFVTMTKDIVYLDEIDNDFLSRLSLSFDLGFTIAQANNLKQLSTILDIGYLTEDWKADAYANVVRSSQDEVDPTKWGNAIVEFTYFLHADWFLFASANFLESDEQQIKLRATGSAGFGIYFIHTNEIYFGSRLGLAWTSETFTDSAETYTKSNEGVFGIEFNMFDVEDFSLFSTLIIYPNFTQSGRVRSDFKLNLKYDLPFDFYIRLGYTINYDSNPIESSPNTDYVLQTTIGWEL